MLDCAILFGFWFFFFDFRFLKVLFTTFIGPNIHHWNRFQVEVLGNWSIKNQNTSYESLKLICLSNAILKQSNCKAEQKENEIDVPSLLCYVMLCYERVQWCDVPPSIGSPWLLRRQWESRNKKKKEQLKE